MSVVVAISGRIAAGKSTVAAGLAAELDWSWASFGELVRVEARLRGRDPDDRAVLQDLGATLIEEMGWPEFVRRTLAGSGIKPGDAPYIVEGVRHVIALDTLRDLEAGVPVELVHLVAQEHDRHARLGQRGVSTADIAAFDRHSTEADVKSNLEARASVVVPADDEALAIIVAWLRQGGHVGDR